MAKTYRLSNGQRMANGLFRMLTERGLGAGYRHVLCVPGRTTGKPRSVPVDVMQVADGRWLVAPYGEVNWVRNVRAARGRVTLRRGRRVETLHAEEVGADEAVPVIRTYIRSVPVTKSYWDVTADSADSEIAADAVNHPVFRLSPAAS
jgi:deazaflavin-dependent oxidoreductase (nitroreductase family)